MIRALRRISSWLSSYRRRQALTRLHRAEQDRAAIRDRIETNRRQHREYKPLVGELRRATTEALRAGLEAGRV